MHLWILQIQTLQQVKLKLQIMGIRQRLKIRLIYQRLKQEVKINQEMINFTHTFLNYHIAKAFPDRQTLDAFTFDLLTTNVFIFFR